MSNRINLFVSYARSNRNLAMRFLEKFQEQLSASEKYEYIPWKDTEILVGENWHEEIQKALKQCDLGLLLISPSFLGSRYIKKHEMPVFVGRDAKPIIPVMLQRVDFVRQNLKGLKKAQFFMLDRPRFERAKSYGECTGAQRVWFEEELFKQVEKKLDKLY